MLSHCAVFIKSRHKDKFKSTYGAKRSLSRFNFASKYKINDRTAILIKTMIYNLAMRFTFSYIPVFLLNYSFRLPLNFIYDSQSLRL